MQAYNLWKHNCNNFSNDLATFLLGKGIPDHIINMPQAVLDSPMGRMLLPHLEQTINANKQRGGILGIQNEAQPTRRPTTSAGQPVPASAASVKNVTSPRELDLLLSSAEKTCAVVFFTSATCPPCKALYPLYDQLAAEVGDKGILVKADISRAVDIGSRYSISATPTFITFLKGQQERRWSGGDPSALRGNVQLLVQMAWPPHPHLSLRLPTLSNPDMKPVIYTKVPPLPKLLAKMGPAADNSAVRGAAQFIEGRAKEGPAQTHLPDVSAFVAFVRDAIQQLPPELLFTVVDLLRCCLIDARFSGYLAEEKDLQTVLAVLGRVNGAAAACPYPLRLVTLQTACNLFSSPLFPEQVLGHDVLRAAVTQLVSTSFLDDGHTNVRVAAASLLFNVSLANGAGRRGTGPPGGGLPEGDQVELAASALEAISQEGESREALEGLLLALGRLVYCMPAEGELADLLKMTDAQGTILAKKQHFKDMPLITEVGAELLGKGLCDRRA